jgi:ArsR family transcriptional regulator
VHWVAPATARSLLVDAISGTHMEGSMPRFARDEPAAVRVGRALAHPLRARILQLLIERDPHRAGALARRFHVALPLMKQHLQRLMQADLVIAERVGDAVYYRIAESRAIEPLRALLVIEN